MITTNHPGQVLVTSENTVNTQNDVTGHAETNLIRKAWKDLPREKFKHTTLYTSTEPCAMCCGAIVWSGGVSRVVYSCTAKKLAEYAGEWFEVPCESIL